MSEKKLPETPYKEVRFTINNEVKIVKIPWEGAMRTFFEYEVCLKGEKND